MRDALSKKIVDIEPSGIRKFFDIVSEMPDAISLGVGEPDFDTPYRVREEGIYSLEKGRTFYTSNAGLKELRDEISRYIARKYNLITDFGKIMDPLADKILVISALVIFVQLEYIPGWMSIIVLAREFLISGIRILAAAKGEIIAAGNLGKYKTTSQMIVIVIALAIGPIGFNLADRFFTIAEILMLIPVILTIWSGWEYTFKAKHYFLEQ